MFFPLFTLSWQQTCDSICGLQRTILRARWQEERMCTREKESDRKWRKLPQATCGWAAHCNHVDTGEQGGTVHIYIVWWFQQGSGKVNTDTCDRSDCEQRQSEERGNLFFGYHSVCIYFAKQMHIFISNSPCPFWLPDCDSFAWFRKNTGLSRHTGWGDMLWMSLWEQLHVPDHIRE